MLCDTRDTGSMLFYNFTRHRRAANRALQVLRDKTNRGPQVTRPTIEQRFARFPAAFYIAVVINPPVVGQYG